ncbi:MAG: double-strand break repair helicase AddA [Sphingomonadales bacterium]|jgi:ATP-dependent helicase/nuclease subunit A|nr:double-strand break repair helicase AddA [Sphingomonadales bacterium]
MTADAEAHKVHELTSAQQAAVVPDANVWLSASAGSGKTQVLSARVIRLLLAGAQPEEILCLTFTKAAAAEMAERINRKLADWVMLDGDRLFHELEAMGAPSGPESRTQARKLFAQILDAPGGGLQIMTIHSFCQSLLASFPEEAGIMPGFEPLDDRTKAELQREVLAQIAQEADATGDLRIAESLHRMGLERGEDGTWGFLQRCAGAVETLRHLPEDQGLLPYVRRQLGLNFDGSIDEIIASLCDDDVIDRGSIMAVRDMNLAWGKDRGVERAGKISAWLGLDPMQRGALIASLHGCWSKSDGEPLISSKGYTPVDDGYARIATDLHLWTSGIVRAKALLAYADKLADALLAGKAFALRYEAIKRTRGLVDFDDLIAKAAGLLTTSGMTQWVRYKLDRRIDHILVDEAQDTNDRQWAIIEALSEDYFAGLGAKGEKPRTIFAVGDFKQAIYGFQGTDPAKYRDAGNRYAQRLVEQDARLHELTLSQSFRSTQPILQLVNAVIETLGHQRFGLADEIESHISEKPDIGSVELLEPVTAAALSESGEGDEDEEKWLGPEKRELAALLAARIKALVDEKTILANGKPLLPGDIMVLFRKRTEVASLLVARLHALKVPVAGIDRMQIGEQLAVQDLVSAIRFVLQPQDDLSLACLLVSPLIGWSQAQLLEHGYRKEGLSLWEQVRRNPAIEHDLVPMREMLASADFTTPYQFLEQILSGPTQGRKKFVARLGDEVLVPIEEFLNLAIEFEQAKGGTLQRFLDWFERNSSEIKRERLTGSNEVQIMTVHGAKGLQAPVVILADVTVDPGAKGGRDPNATLPLTEGGALPMLKVDKDSRFGRLAEIDDARETSELNEHFRLLYVALTRAEERLIMAGSLGKRDKAPKADSWHVAIESAMDALGCAQQSDAKGRITRMLSGAAEPKVEPASKVEGDAATPSGLPDWLLRPAAAEVRPPRPLAPSHLDDSDIGERPAGAAMRHAAERGKLVHGLIERVDGSRLARFGEDAAIWLAERDREGRHDHAALIAQVRALLSDPRWQKLFSESARAEVPIAAVVGETVVAGRIDRLLVEEGEVRIVDFKTSRRIPANAAEVQLSELRQMAHYASAIERIFPEHRVTASLLYTSGPTMIELSDADLAAHKPV